jgi:hypothetical protein
MSLAPLASKLLMTVNAGVASGDMFLDSSPFTRQWDDGGRDVVGVHMRRLGRTVAYQTRRSVETLESMDGVLVLFPLCVVSRPDPLLPRGCAAVAPACARLARPAPRLSPAVRTAALQPSFCSYCRLVPALYLLRSPPCLVPFVPFPHPIAIRSLAFPHPACVCVRAFLCVCACACVPGSRACLTRGPRWPWSRCHHPRLWVPRAPPTPPCRPPPPPPLAAPAPAPPSRLPGRRWGGPPPRAAAVAPAAAAGWGCSWTRCAVWCSCCGCCWRPARPTRTGWRTSTCLASLATFWSACPVCTSPGTRSTPWCRYVAVPLSACVRVFVCVCVGGGGGVCAGVVAVGVWRRGAVCSWIACSALCLCAHVRARVWCAAMHPGVLTSLTPSPPFPLRGLCGPQLVGSRLVEDPSGAGYKQLLFNLGIWTRCSRGVQVCPVCCAALV